jgi:predicted dehydrogenase
VVVISTLHDSLAPLTLAAIRAGKHVLVEKPAARSARELFPLLAAAKKARVQVRVGYNHRFHRAFRKAREIVDAGKLGPLMMIRARYGHGGRLGYEKEWRADPKKSGGGELIDQGVPLIDLARWFMGDFSKIEGFAQTLFWKMPVDDNAFMLLRTKKGQTASLHASCTEWKNLFSFEIYGRVGKLHIEGLGGSYGMERLTWYRMLPQMGPPETKAWEFPQGDDSWEFEMREFAKDILLCRKSQPSLQDGLETLKVVDRIYCKSR